MQVDYYVVGFVLSAVSVPFLVWSLIHRLRWSFLATWNMLLAIACLQLANAFFPIFAFFFVVFALVATVCELLPVLRS